jgi:FAD/FMN-containing dehydrogenase
MTHGQNTHIAQAVQMLTAQLDAAKVLASGPAYDEARQVWNAAVSRRPAVIVLCDSTGDVQSSVRTATICCLSLSVRGGGHNWAGRALQGELVVDLTRMQHISVEGRVATVSGGATSMAVAEAAHPYGLAAVTGTMGCVGMAGLTLGGVATDPSRGDSAWRRTTSWERKWCSPTAGWFGPMRRPCQCWPRRGR